MNPARLLRRSAAVFTLGFVLQAPTALASEILAELGSTNFTVDVTNTTAGYTQSTTNLTLTSPFGLGDLVGGQFTNVYNWSGISSFGLLMSAPGTSPDTSFTVEFFDGQLSAIVNAYQGSASGLTTTPSVVPITLSLPGTGDLSAIGGFQFTWNAPGSGEVVLAGIVPEPSTWALMGLGALLGGFLWAHRRFTRD